ncbi:MAG: SCO family protein [Candidatus Tectomicrobia bacterium]|nr:SCO family protein [Candidatus Tectomicrobia bacterium]
MNRDNGWRISVSGLSMLFVLGWFATGAVAGPHDHTMQSELPVGAYSSDSLYQLTSTWTTATGQRLQLGALRDKARVVVMYYSTCEYACPILISRVKNIEAGLQPESRDKVGFVGVTFDPERDTLPVLQAYRAKMHLNPEHWTLLRGQPDDILELAVLLGVKYRKNPQGDFSHSNLITVLNPAGEIVYRQVGLHQPIAETIAAIHQVAQDVTQ